MTSKADELLARLAEAQRKVVAADKARDDAAAAVEKAQVAWGDARAELRAARDAIEREAAGV